AGKRMATEGQQAAVTGTQHPHLVSAPMARPLDVVEDLGAPRLRCAPFRSALGVGSAGTAGAYDAFLCVDVPLPWERDISWSEPFRTLVGEGTTSVRAPDGRTIRPQGLVPVPGTEGRTRV